MKVVSGGAGFDALVFLAVQHTLSLLEPWGPVQNMATVFNLHQKKHTDPFPFLFAILVSTSNMY